MYFYIYIYIYIYVFGSSDVGLSANLLGNNGKANLSFSCWP